MFDRITLTRDLVDCSGTLLGKKGLIISAQSIADAASRAPANSRRLLSDTFIAEDLYLPLAEASYRYLFQGPGVQANVARALLSIRLPAVLYEELRIMRQDHSHRYRHALATAAVATRLLAAVVGDARGLPEVGAAALLHDLGMCHLPDYLLRHTEALRPNETAEVAAHPFLGAYHLACVLGLHPAVDAALFHHWKNNQGYPRLARTPARSVEVVAVASAFAALTQPRTFRSDPFDARGAVDLLVLETAAGHADESTVKLLVHTLRGSKGDFRTIRFGRERLGHAPVVNRYTPIAIPQRSLM